MNPNTLPTIRPEMVSYDVANQLQVPVEQAAQTNADLHNIAPNPDVNKGSEWQVAPDGHEQENRQESRAHRFGRIAIARGALELVGAGVDTVLMAGGAAGIAPLASVTGRETVATSGDVVLMNKIMGGESEAAPSLEQPRRKKVAKKAGELMLGVTTAIVAQKLGVELVDHISSSLNGGAGEYAVPIASKIAAAAGVNKFVGR